MVWRRAPVVVAHHPGAFPTSPREPPYRLEEVRVDVLLGRRLARLGASLEARSADLAYYDHPRTIPPLGHVGVSDSQVASIAMTASVSLWVIVSPHGIFTFVQSVAYWHQ